ncbi:hypothetical protein H0H87_010942, partial [Tephrocybe sp. NHM501043]
QQLRPTFADINTTEPFRSFIFSTPASTALTNTDFSALENEMPLAHRRWEEASTSFLKTLLPAIYQGPSPNLNLATVFFRCKWCREPLSYPRVLVHKCFQNLGRQSDGVDLAVPNADLGQLQLQKGDRPWNWGTEQVTFHDEASKNAWEIVEACGADPLETVKESMDAIDCMLECLCCEKEGRAMNWESAIMHTLRVHSRSDSIGPKWQLIKDPKVLQRLKEQATKNSWDRDFSLVACKHCSMLMEFRTAAQHMKKNHNIEESSGSLDIGTLHTNPALDRKMPTTYLNIDEARKMALVSDEEGSQAFALSTECTSV